MHLFLICDVLHQRPIGGARFGPVSSVHLRIVEAVLHDPPRLFEHLLALGLMIDLNARREVDAAWRGTSGCACALRACASGSSSGARACSSRPCRGRNCDAINAPALVVVKRAAIPRKLQ